MVIDSVTSGYAPFQGFDLSTNFHEYLKVFDEILAYKFDTFVGGHLTDIGTRQDVEITKEFTLDVYNTVKRIHKQHGRNCCYIGSGQKPLGRTTSSYCSRCFWTRSRTIQ